MIIRPRLAKPADGFTLTELLTVLAILSILIAVAAGTYSRFISKAQSVEAEVALAEIQRLEQLHYVSTGTYTTNVEELGFKPVLPLKYYSVSVQVAGEPGNAAFRALAEPVSGGSGQTFAIVQYSQASPSANNGAGGTSGVGSSTGFAFGGEGWNDPSIIRLDPGGGPKGGIEKVVQNQKSTGLAPTAK